MGQQALNEADVTKALIEAIGRVVPRQVDFSPSTPINQTGLDSLGLIETMVHLEDVIGLRLDETTIRNIVAAPDFRPQMTLDELAGLLRDSYATEVEVSTDAGPDFAAET